MGRRQRDRLASGLAGREERRRLVGQAGRRLGLGTLAGRRRGARRGSDREGLGDRQLLDPGRLDTLWWVQGDDWDDVWNKARHLRQEGWQTTTQVAMHSWWNQEKLNAWT